MVKRAAPMSQIKVGFPDSVRQKIKSLAAERDESEAMIVREMVRKYLALEVA